MTHISKMIPKMFLSKDDFDKPKLLTIKKCYLKTFNDGTQKWTLDFEETSKPLTLNNTNLQLLPIICGSEESDDWAGKQIVVYYDPTIIYMGKPVGGIRIRAKNNFQHVQNEQHQDVQNFDDVNDDEVPF